MRILAISGSLRARSSNTLLLRKMADAVPAVTLYDELALIPPFNPDLEAELAGTGAVGRFRALVREARAVVFSTPEYAHGIPGVLKNALDWIVGTGELSGKPVALVNPSARGLHAQAALREVLTTMDARLVSDSELFDGWKVLRDNKILAPATQKETLAWTVPANKTKGIGKVILKTDSADLIDGVRVNAFPLWPDDRGYFAEIVRIGQGLPADFPASSTQVSTALSYPGTIKAFHYHLEQTDFWVPVNGMFQVVLCDLRPDSHTFGLRNTLYVGTLRPWQILIPPGVGHGYKVIGAEPAMLVYVTNRIYNPKDEGRIAHDEPGINYDWELQHK